MKRFTRIQKRRIRRPKDCYFCKESVIPDYKDEETFRRFVTERGKIIGKMYSGVCQKHQIDLARSIKRARYLAFLPFIVRPS